MNTSVFVRRLTDEEHMRLNQFMGRSPTARIWRRARAILLSNEQMTVPQIARIVVMTAKTVRTLIRTFTQHGIAALEDKKRSGRKKNFLKER